jgi:hypothetical protein
MSLAEDREAAYKLIEKIPITARLMRRTLTTIALLATGVLIIACAPAAMSTSAPLPTTATLAPPKTALEIPTARAPVSGDRAMGEQLWPQNPCSGRHGANAGGIGPRLAGTVLSFDQVLMQVRQGGGRMPAFSESQISDTEVQHIHAWL